MTDDTLDQERLRDLLSRTAQLPREIDPPADAWTAIKTAIETREKPVAAAFWQKPLFLAAAALLLVAASSMITAIALGGRDPSTGQSVPVVATETAHPVPEIRVAETPVETAPPSTERVIDPVPAAPAIVASAPVRTLDTPATLAEFTKQENEYISTANRLSQILESESMQLSPRTKAKMRESIRVIDAAILEARRALAEDPANRQLIEMLSTSYNQKLDFLKRVTEMGRS